MSEWGGPCPGANALSTGSAVTIEAEQTQRSSSGFNLGEGSGGENSQSGRGASSGSETEGNRGTGVSGSAGGGGGAGGGVQKVVVPSVKGDEAGPGLFELAPDRFARLCPEGSICQPVPAAPAVPGAPGQPGEPAAALVVTISDLVSFTPADATQAMQPARWIAVGLATNFIGTASVHVEEGDLLGYPALVRFTPAAFTWNYGDGSTGTGAGATWQALGVPEFSDTTTSHIYSEPGPYDITLTVEYTAEYRFAGSNWSPVVGTVSTTSPPLTAPASIVRTVLVPEDCLQNPRGVGCP